MQAFQQYVLNTPDGLNNEQAREYLFFKIGYPNAAGAHILYAVVFALNDVTWLAWYNVIVAIAFGLAAAVRHKFMNPLWLFVPLWLVEIPFHALLGTLTTGVLTMFWFVPIASAVPCLLITSFSWQAKALLASSLTIYSGVLLSLGFFLQPSTPLPTPAAVVLFLCNFQILAAMIFYIAVVQRVVQVAEARQQEEFDRAESLLLNILPRSIADRLKNGERLIAEDHEEVSIVFADIADFTAVSSKLSPAQLVETLNLVFSEFDKISDRHGAEKIKTIGDAYMCAGGLPFKTVDHAKKMVKAAMEIASFVKTSRNSKREDIAHFDIRIGINTGPVVAGVVGSKKFAYDIWGDTVNVAARMESNSESGMINISENTYALVKKDFECEYRGEIDVKNKGMMKMYYVNGKKQGFYDLHHKKHSRPEPVFKEKDDIPI